MKKVKMLVHTGYDGKKIMPGDVLEVSDLLAERWTDHNIAELVPEIKKPAKQRKPRTKPSDVIPDGD